MTQTAIRPIEKREAPACSLRVEITVRVGEVEQTVGLELAGSTPITDTEATALCARAWKEIKRDG